MAILASYLSMVVTPWTIQQINQVLADDEYQADLRGISAGRFSEYSRGDIVFYVESLSKDNQMKNVFVQSRQHQKLGITASDGGRIYVDPESGDRFIILTDGYRYEGQPGQANYQITRFDEYAVRVAEQKPQLLTQDVKSRPTAALYKSNQPRAVAEFQRRLSVPLSILVFALLSLPISRVSPRGGMYGNLLTALLIYVIFENLSNLSNSWIVREQAPSWLGMWWVHVLLALTGVILVILDLGPKWVFRRRNSAEVTP
jgi:lipopolysaccharide export system permease protein